MQQNSAKRAQPWSRTLSLHLFTEEALELIFKARQRGSPCEFGAQHARTTTFPNLQRALCSSRISASNPM